MSEHDEEQDILDYLQSRLVTWRSRIVRLGTAPFAFEKVESHVGRLGHDTYLRDGAVAQMRVPSFALLEHREWAHREFGRPWFTAHVTVSEADECSFVFEYDVPPVAHELRTVECCATDLKLYPRGPALVPGWMKVELALVGAWDLVQDKLTVNRRWEPTGRPQTATSVGVGLPPGAEHAWTPAVFDESPPLPSRVPGAGAADREVVAWTVPLEVVPGALVVGLGQRWSRLAAEYHPVVQLVKPGAALMDGDESVGVAPALAEVLAAFPGVAVDGLVLDWPQGRSESWPELGDRFSYQPLSSRGREAIAVRIDPDTGAPGEVVHLSEEGELTVVGPDPLTWLRAFTDWAEEMLPALRSELEGQAADAEELQIFLAEAIDQEFTTWIEQR